MRKLIENLFDRTAYDVSLTDDSWPQDKFDVISGNISQSWERLDAWVIIICSNAIFHNFFSLKRKFEFWIMYVEIAAVVFFHILSNWMPKLKECFMVLQLSLLSVSLLRLPFRCDLFSVQCSVFKSCINTNRRQL